MQWSFLLVIFGLLYPKLSTSQSETITRKYYTIIRRPPSENNSQKNNISLQLEENATDYQKDKSEINPVYVRPDDFNKQQTFRTLAQQNSLDEKTKTRIKNLFPKREKLILAKKDSLQIQDNKDFGNIDHQQKKLRLPNLAAMRLKYNQQPKFLYSDQSSNDFQIGEYKVNTQSLKKKSFELKDANSRKHIGTGREDWTDKAVGRQYESSSSNTNDNNEEYDERFGKFEDGFDKYRGREYQADMVEKYSGYKKNAMRGGIWNNLIARNSQIKSSDGSYGNRCENKGDQPNGGTKGQSRECKSKSGEAVSANVYSDITQMGTSGIRGQSSQSGGYEYGSGESGDGQTGRSNGYEGEERQTGRSNGYEGEERQTGKSKGYEVEGRQIGEAVEYESLIQAGRTSGRGREGSSQFGSKHSEANQMESSGGTDRSEKSGQIGKSNINVDEKQADSSCSKGDGKTAVSDNGMQKKANDQDSEEALKTYFLNVNDKTFNFEYEVDDERKNNFQSHRATDDGLAATGSYSWRDQNGNLRTVDYIADHVTGFRAVVRDEKGQSEWGFVSDGTDYTYKDNDGVNNNNNKDGGGTKGGYGVDMIKDENTRNSYGGEEKSGGVYSSSGRGGNSGYGGVASGNKGMESSGSKGGEYKSGMDDDIKEVVGNKYK